MQGRQSIIDSYGSQQPRSSPLVRYGVAIATSFLALVVALLLTPLMGSNAFSIFLIAVIASAYVGGIGPAIVTIIFSALLNTYFFLAPRYSLIVTELNSLVQLALFTVAAIVISTLMSERRRAEERAATQREELDVTLRSIGDGVITTDTAGHITFMNPVAEQLTGWSREEAIGRDILAVFQIVRHGDRQPVENPIERVLREGITVGLANHTLLVCRDGSERPIDDSGAPIRDRAGNIWGAVLVFHDVTDRYRAEQEQAELFAREHQALMATETARQQLAFLSEASQLLMASLDYEVALRTVAQLATTHLADWAVVDMADETGAIRRVVVATADPARQPLADALRAYPADPTAPSGPGFVLRSGQSLLVPHVSPDELAEVARDETYLAVLQSLGIASTMLVPLAVRGQTIGVLTFTRFDSAQPFTQDDLTVAEELARRAAQAIDNARLYAVAQNEVAARRRAEEALRESEQRFRATFEQAAVGIAHVLPDGTWQQVNQRLCEILGYSSQEMRERTFQDITHPDDLSADLGYVQGMLAGTIQTYTMEKRYIRKDNSIIWADLTVSLVRDGDHKPHYFISVIADSTARKQAEAERDRLLELERAARTTAETFAGQLQRVQSVTDTALAHLSLDDLLEEMLERISAILYADIASILLYDAEDGALVVRATHGLEEDLNNQFRIPYGAGFAGRVVKERRVIALDEVNEEEIFSPTLRNKKVASLLGAPLLVEGNVTGTVQIGTLQPRVFTGEDMRLIQLVADRVALAIAQAQRYDAQQRALKRLSALQEIDRAILRAEAPDRISRAALVRMQQLVPYDYGAVTMTDERSGRRLLAEYGDTTFDASEDGIRNAITVPLEVGGTFMGRIDLFARSSTRFVSEYQKIVGEIANQLAIAVQQTRFREALQQANAELEQRVVERTGELQAVVDDLNTFTYTISHDLRAPLRSLQGFGTALLEDYTEELPAEGQTYLGYIVSAAEQMDQLLQDLLAYSRLSRTGLSLNPVELESVVADAQNQLVDLIARSGADITVEKPLPTVRAHYPTLVQVVTNLIANAIKFIAPNVRPQIRICAERKSGIARLVVMDNGIGVRLVDQERIFNVFERLHGAETYPGTGVGLAIVRKAIERMGGRTGVDSEFGAGSQFWIELPAEDV